MPGPGSITNFRSPIESFGAIVPWKPSSNQGTGPTINNFLNFISQQLKQFAQSHLASHANHFAQTHGIHTPAQQMDLGKQLQGFAQQLAQAMHPGGYQPASGSDNYDDGINHQNLMYKQSQTMKEQDGRNKLHLKGIDNGNAYV